MGANESAMTEPPHTRVDHGIRFPRMRSCDALISTMEVARCILVYVYRDHEILRPNDVHASLLTLSTAARMMKPRVRITHLHDIAKLNEQIASRNPVGAILLRDGSEDTLTAIVLLDYAQRTDGTYVYHAVTPVRSMGVDGKLRLTEDELLRNCVDWCAMHRGSYDALSDDEYEEADNNEVPAFEDD
jgi:hypothetical protein